MDGACAGPGQQSTPTGPGRLIFVTYTGDVRVGGSSDTREIDGLTVTKIAVGSYENNTYLLRDRTGQGLLIDAAAEPRRLLEMIGDTPVQRIVTTHRHADHWQALAEVKAATGAATVAHPADAPGIPVATDELVDDGGAVGFGDTVLSVIHLVGHTPGSIALCYLPDDRVPDGQLEQSGPGGLDGIPGGQLGDRRLVEGPGLQHGAFGVARDEIAEQVVVERRVDHHHGEQVHGEGERVGAEAEAVGADAAVVPGVRHCPGQRPAVVVDRGGLAAVVFGRAEEFLGELAEHAAPQVEVVALVPPRLAGRLEDAYRDNLVHPARVADQRRVPPVQRERRGARDAV